MTGRNSVARHALGRLLGAVAVVYLVLTVMVVLLYGLAQDWVEKQIAEIEFLYRVNEITAIERRELIAAVRETYGAGRPLSSRLVEWWVDVPTLDFGRSIVYQRPVVDVLEPRVVRTLEYAVPGILLGMVLGVGLGLAVALTRRRVVDLGARLTTYGLFGVPVFMVLTYLQVLAGKSTSALGVTVTLPAPGPTVLATLAVAGSLLASQLRFTRSSVRDLRTDPFVKVLEGKGIGRSGMARHLLRNVAVPLLTLSIAELLGTLVLSIYVVEEVLAIDGLGAATLVAVRRADVSLVVWATLVVVVLALVLSVLHEVVADWLDPRIRDG